MTINELKEKLIKEADDKIEKLGDKEVGTDDYKIGVESVTTLVKAAEEIENNESEREVENKKTKSEAIHNWICSGTKVVGVVASIAVPVGIALLTYKGEIKGVIQTTEAGKASLRRCLNFVFKS